MGRLVKEKQPEETLEIAERIRSMDVDVLAVQEVEHIEILKEFNNSFLHGMYGHAALVEGNDSRLIDVGVLSKLPIGPITSHQTATHPEDPNRRVFSRDLLEVEILDTNRKKLFTFYNTHLKSHYIPYGQDPVQGVINANNRRRRQAEIIAEIITSRQRPNSKFVLAGDMNDTPDSETLAPMLTVDGNRLINALTNATETRAAKTETSGQGDGPQSPVWTHRYNPSGPEPPQYELYDQIWVSPALANSFEDPMIDRRKTHGGDGSDHDPAWITLVL